VNGGVVFSADFPGFSAADHQSALHLLSSKLVSGTGPHTLFMKTIESGLAYTNSVGSEPRLKLLYYYADHVPDIAALVALANSVAAEIPHLEDASLLDYTLQKAFPFQRSMSSFTDRGKSIAQDLYDGNNPEKVRHLSEEVLKLRSDPALQGEIIRSGLSSIAPVLLNPEFREVQRMERSVFLFAGPERLLADAEKRLVIPKFLRLYPSDFWLE
jgi:hypothetical protein